MEDQFTYFPLLVVIVGKEDQPILVNYDSIPMGVSFQVLVTNASKRDIDVYNKAFACGRSFEESRR